MVAEASNAMSQDPWLLVPTGGALVITVMAFGLIGDAVRDATMGRTASTAALLQRRAHRRDTERPTAPMWGDRGRPSLSALHNVDLSLTAGETLSVVGESGSGKSTLGNAVLGLVAPTAGTIRFADEDITHASARRRRALSQDIQVVFQNPHGSLNPVRTIGQTLEEPLLAHRALSRPQRRAEVAKALERVRLDGDAAARYPAQFSGGQLQRIAIARALMLSPRLIICDEAVSSLDLSIQAQILNLLHDLQQELRLSYLFISHDLAVVRHISNRVAVLYHGRLMESGGASEGCEHPRHPYTQALLAAAPVPNPTQQRSHRLRHSRSAQTDIETPADPGCPFRTRCQHAAGMCADPLPVYTTTSGAVACHRYPELQAERLRDLAPRQNDSSSRTASGSTSLR